MHLYVLQTLAGDEQKLLNRCGIDVCRDDEEAFVPTVERTKRYRKTEKIIRTAMFPGYVFFRTGDPVGLFFRLKTVPLLSKLLRVNEEFLHVTEDEDEVISSLGGKDHNAEGSVGIIEGGRLTILQGPLKDFTGDIVHIDRHKKTATIALYFLGERRTITLGLEVTKKT